MTTATAVAVKERPILFSAPMVRAILEGRKTQTRRVIQHPRSTGAFVCVQGFWKEDPSGWWPFVSHDGESFDDGNGCEVPLNCTYGVPGDRLWVKETYAELSLGYSENYGEFRWGVWHPSDRERCAHHKADVHPEVEKLIDRWRPSIFMPRWASRITLEITKVRVERVRDITCADVWSEGISRDFTQFVRDELTIEQSVAESKFYIGKFHELWDSINASRGFGWDANPWVWVVEFKRITA